LALGLTDAVQRDLAPALDRLRLHPKSNPQLVHRGLAGKQLQHSLPAFLCTAATRAAAAHAGRLLRLATLGFGVGHHLVTSVNVV
jgi:hypothetical protein